MDPKLESVVLQYLGRQDEAAQNEIRTLFASWGVKDFSDLAVLDFRDFSSLTLVQRRRLETLQSFYRVNASKPDEWWRNLQIRDLDDFTITQQATTVVPQQDSNHYNLYADEYYTHQVFKLRSQRWFAGVLVLVVITFVVIVLLKFPDNPELLIPALFLSFLVSILLIALITLLLQVGIGCGCCTEACLTNPCP